jgi:hypothetical protein
MSHIDNNPLNFKFEVTQAKAFGYFDGQKKSRLILNDLNSKVVKIAAEQLDETNGERLFEKQNQTDSLNWYTTHVVAKVCGTWVKINIASASKRLGINASELFQSVKNGKFTDLLKQKSGLNFQKDVESTLKEPLTENDRAQFREELEEATDFVAQSRISSRKLTQANTQKNFDITYSTSKDTPLTLSFKKDNSLIAKKLNSEFSFFFEKTDKGSHFEETSIKDTLQNLNDIQKLQLAELLIKDILLPRQRQLFSGSIKFEDLKIGRNESGDILCVKEALTSKNTSNRTAQKTEDLNLPAVNLLNQILENILKFEMDAIFDLTNARTLISDQKSRLLLEIEDKTDKLMGLWSNRIQDISDPNKQPLNRDDCKRIVESVVLNQKELLAEASVHPNKTLYLRVIKGVKLPRAVQIDADGSIFIHFNKSKQNDRVIGEGSFKKVRFAIKLNDMHVYAVAKVKVTTQQQLVAQQEEGRFLKLLKGLDGVSQIEKEVLVKGKNGQDKLLMIQPYYNSGDLFTNICGRSLTPKEKLKITLDLLKGLASIHSKDIIHRDIKPQNVFLSKNEQGELSAFMGDFGLSTINTDDAKKAKHVGTFEYMSPEYVRTFDLKDRAGTIAVTNEKLDSWALGTALFMLYTGNIVPPWFDRNYFWNDIHVLYTLANITSINTAWFDAVNPEVIKNLIQDLIQIDTTSRLSAQEALTKYEHDIKAELQ